MDYTRDCVIPLRDVRRVQFGIFGPDELRRISVVEGGLVYSKTMRAGKPIFGGLMDPRQGVMDCNSRCLTCAGNMLQCPGHFAHIDLSAPVYHIGFLMKTVKVLRCVCFYCAELLVDPVSEKVKDICDKTKAMPGKRLVHIYALWKNLAECKQETTKICRVCGQYQPNYFQNGTDLTCRWLKMNEESQDRTIVVLTAKKAREIFQRISDEHLKILGMDPKHARPEWMICTVLPVPPPCVRPAVATFGSTKRKDDLTYKLAKIIKANNRLKRALIDNCANHIIEIHVRKLQFHVATLIDNDFPDVPKAFQRSGQCLKSIKQRLIGKRGRVRGNLMGKSVEFSARTVVTPDPNLRIDQIGVPRSIALNMTYSELVTKFNIDSCITPYRAEYGDEMNLHFLQSLETRVEMSQLSNVQCLIINPQSNRPAMEVEQDALTAVWKMTKRDVFLDRGQMMNLVMFLPSWDVRMPKPAILKPKPLWTGKQLLSLVIPGPVNLVGTHYSHPDAEDYGPYKWISPGDTKVLIEDGELLSGILCKRTLGPVPGCLTHVICLEIGHEAAGVFYGSIQMVVNNWLLIEGHSFGIGDIIVDMQTYIAIRNTIKQAKLHVMELFEKTSHEKLEHASGTTCKQTFENQVNHVLSCVKYKTGCIAQKSLSESNNFKAMIVAGTKGSHMDITQVIACIGQQKVNNKRIPFGFHHRTLPHFMKVDLSPESRGFVEHSYVDGLTPSEFFFHAMEGREKLINKTVTTSESGYIQRCLVKAMESVMVKYDGTVRDHTEQLIQFCYGEDGLDAVNVEFQSLPTLKPSNKDFEENFKLNTQKACHLKKNLKEVMQDLQMNAHAQMEIEQEWEQLKKDRELLRQIFQSGDSKVVLPCNLQRMIWNAQKRFRIDSRKPTDLHPLKVIEDIKELCKRLTVIPGDDRLSVLANDNATLLMKVLIRSTFCSKNTIDVHHLTSEAFDWLIGEIETKFQQAQVHPGEMVGVLAAQSFCPSEAQTTLNVFNYAGVLDQHAHVSLGISRLKEIIDICKKPKTPTHTVFLTGQASREADLAMDMAHRLEHTTLRHIIETQSIIYDPDPQSTKIAVDKEWVKLYYEKPEITMMGLSPWLLRLELIKENMRYKKLTLEQICDKITERIKNINCIFNDDNAQHLILRVRVQNSEDNNITDEEENAADKIEYDVLLQFIAETLSDMTIGGVKGITKVHLCTTTNNQHTFISDDGIFRASREWILETNGSSLKRILSERDVDPVRTTSNDILEVFHMLGIEAARKCIEQEINHVITFNGSYVNYRHLALLCDVMTSRGHIMSISADGINKWNSGPLARCSFDNAVSNVFCFKFE